MSVQKALQDSKTNTRELLKGIKEINVLPDDEGSLICLVTGPVVGIFFTKRQTEKNELVTRPVEQAAQ